MRSRPKVAVTIPAELLGAVDHLCKRSGATRSAVFERALSSYLTEADRVGRARRYTAGYRQRPERAGEQRAALVRALEALADQEWDA